MRGLQSISELKRCVSIGLAVGSATSARLVLCWSPDRGSLVFHVGGWDMEVTTQLSLKKNSTLIIL